jgi:hypothetical protein
MAAVNYSGQNTARRDEVGLLGVYDQQIRFFPDFECA